MTELLRPSRLKDFQIESVTLLEDNVLGNGAYGVVYQAKFGELLCAAKLLHPVLFRYGNLDEHSVMVRKFEQECQLLSLVKHPCIVQYLATYIHPKSSQPVLLMELIDESLSMFLQKSKVSLPLHTQTNLIQDISMALDYLHSNEVIHRDLTGNNVLVVAGKHAKVTDFGMLKIIDGQMENNPRLRQLTMCPGCPVYMPPEAFTNPPKYTNKLDIFSLGVIIIQILTRSFPSPADLRGVTDNEIERRRSHISTIDSNHPLLRIALQCLKNKDTQRPKSADVCRQLNDIKKSARYEESVRVAEELELTTSDLVGELLAARREVSNLSAQLEDARGDLQKLQNVINSSSKASRLLRRTSSDGLAINRGTDGLARNGAAPMLGELSSKVSSRDSKDYESLSDEEYELDANTLPTSAWYHGKIDRDTASRRLHANGRPGAYLIRNSESTPNNYVLMFLDKERRAFNYMITYSNGKFNASGQSSRWFKSLQELVAYYTKFSTIKQNQHLDVPVIPPEAVPLPTKV